MAIKMFSSDEKTDIILICGECNKNASAVTRLCRQETFYQKRFVFSQFHLAKRITFISKFTKLHS
jgi:succinyl-CoA synthetase alpha subunit